MTQVREIAQLGAEVLRLKAKPVRAIQTLEIQQVIADLFATLASTNGVGLAAPQIYESYQMLIVASRPSERYPYAPLMQSTLMINPSFDACGELMEKDWEGCLSIPGIRAQVPRYTQIKVSYTGIDGAVIEQILDGFVARVFQHEYDHLEGLVYLDRVETNRDIISESEFLTQVTSLKEVEMTKNK